MATSHIDNADRYGPGTAYAEPPAGIGGLVKMVIGAVALLGVLVFGWVVWIAYDEGVRTGAAKTVPVIAADTSAVKRKPEDPGGLAIPHQDKLVFNRLAPGQADEPVERLLPQPEAPIPLPVRDSAEPPPKSLDPAAAPADPEIATALTPSLVEPVPEKIAPPPPPEPAPDPAEIIANTPPSAPPPPAELTVKPSPPPAATPAPAPAPAELAAKTPPPPPAPPPAAEKAPEIAPGAGWGIQLVSLSNRKDAEQVWARLQKANSDLLGGLQLRVQSVKLAKGTFYRIQAGPLPDRAAADSLCGSLKSRKQDCLVVAPKR